MAFLVSQPDLNGCKSKHVLLPYAAIEGIVFLWRYYAVRWQVIPNRFNLALVV